MTQPETLLTPDKLLLLPELIEIAAVSRMFHTEGPKGKIPEQLFRLRANGIHLELQQYSIKNPYNYLIYEVIGSTNTLKCELKKEISPARPANAKFKSFLASLLMTGNLPMAAPFDPDLSLSDFHVDQRAVDLLSNVWINITGAPNEFQFGIRSVVTLVGQHLAHDHFYELTTGSREERIEFGAQSAPEHLGKIAAYYQTYFSGAWN